MAWTIEFTTKAAKAFRKLDKPVQRRIATFLRDVADGEPRRKGKPLKADLAGLWRWPVGDWRVVANLEDDVLLILVVDVDHRSRVYTQ
ncbi:type II toxin-antitoxin system RelE/ParE family toxin [uncultured Tessaracoccus sp.]|uniref:type II toxin-antitoxin system RelE family toxin n=1 Tax=uncultured Tessaracoccus sp. TaxID=905023 RepID=UPI0025F210D9|nr:type II toxin-antitoxin system RelE/ParE family toxin [uncultured Tessaracoccus sp.]